MKKIIVAIFCSATINATAQEAPAGDSLHSSLPALDLESLKKMIPGADTEGGGLKQTLLNKVKGKVGDKLEQKGEEKLDKTMDKLLSGNFLKKKKKKKEEAENELDKHNEKSVEKIVPPAIVPAALVADSLQKNLPIKY